MRAFNSYQRVRQTDVGDRCSGNQRQHLDGPDLPVSATASLFGKADSNASQEDPQIA